MPNPRRTNEKRLATDIFSPVTVDRASYIIVEQIKDLIRDNTLAPGDRLPSERDLCERFGVSRVTVREGLRVLEASGLITVKVGAHGGAFVTKPSAEQLGEGLADLISLTPITSTDVTEMRIIVELGILPLVVKRATAADLDDLFTIVRAGKEALAEGTYTMERSAAFHIRVADCTHNPAIVALVQSFHGPLLMSLREASVAAPLMGHRGTDEHQKLAEAIRDRDVDAAIAVMRRHLNRTANRLRSLDR